MKTFEEKFTAWIDGKLTGKELADFERELESVETVQAEKADAQKLGDLMRTHLQAPELKNADFFNHQLMQQIEAEQSRAQVPAAHESQPRSWSFWTLPRMAWAGIFCMLLATGLYFAAVPKTTHQMDENREYVAKVLSAETDDPDISATAFHSKESNATVVWLSGLDYIPAENYKAK